MKFNLALVFGAVALMGLFGVTIAEMRTNETETEVDVLADESVLVDPEDADRSVRPIVPVQPTYRDYHPQRARGLKIRPDGVTVGRIFYIDRNSLTLSPVQNAQIGVLQNRRIVAQAVTDEQGTFSVPGLTPWGVYSVTAASEHWVSVFSAVIIPRADLIPREDAVPQEDPVQQEDHELQAGDRSADEDVWVNEIRLVAAGSFDDGDDEDAQVDALEADEVAIEEVEELVTDNPGVAEPQSKRLRKGELQEVDAQAIPREDFIVAVRAGLFGTDVCGLPPAMAGGCCPSHGGISGGGAGAGGGGGGGGAGGGGLGGLGGALLGAGIGAAVGAGAGSDSASPASPFAP